MTNNSSEDKCRVDGLGTGFILALRNQTKADESGDTLHARLLECADRTEDICREDCRMVEMELRAKLAALDRLISLNASLAKSYKEVAL